MSGEEGQEAQKPKDPYSRLNLLIENYLKTAPDLPIVEVLKRLGISKKSANEGESKALTAEEVGEFRRKMVDSGMIPETTTETRISDEDLKRLEDMSPEARDLAVKTGIRNIVAKTNGLSTTPGGVEFKTYEINNRTGESKPINPQNSPKH